jgi:hypothetical protein
MTKLDNIMDFQHTSLGVDAAQRRASRQAVGTIEKENSRGSMISVGEAKANS